MREYPTAWRDVDGRAAPAPRRGEGVYNIVQDGVDYPRGATRRTPRGARPARRTGGMARSVLIRLATRTPPA